jgi:exo-1,4-beta-D-glucosaminidase
MCKLMKKNNFPKLAIVTIIGLFLTSCTSSDMQQIGDEYINSAWELFPAAKATVSDSIVSTADFSPAEAQTIELPATVLSGLRQNGQFEDIYYNQGLEKIDPAPFQQPWWYRKEIVLENPDSSIHHQLILEGINYKAELWINWQKASSNQPMEGAFGIYDYQITPFLVKGKNIIAVKVSPPKTGDLTLGFVDWNPEAPDKNMGLWRGVRLKTTGSISLTHANVRSKVNTETLDAADLTVSVFAKNLTDQPQTAELKAKLLDKYLSKIIELAPGPE